MDPDEVLRQIRALATIVHEQDDATAGAVALAEHVQALDGWISRGGFLPAAWTRDR